MSRANTPNTSVDHAAQGRNRFNATLVDYLTKRDAHNTLEGDPTKQQEAAYLAALKAAWALRPKTRSEGIAFARFMLAELKNGYPTDGEGFADAVETTLKVLLIQPEPNAIAERVSEARQQIESAQGNVRGLRGLFLTMADSTSEQAGATIQLNGNDYTAALCLLANQAEHLADAFEEPIKTLMDATDALEGRA